VSHENKEVNVKLFLLLPRSINFLGFPCGKKESVGEALVLIQWHSPGASKGKARDKSLIHKSLGKGGKGVGGEDNNNNNNNNNKKNAWG